MALIPTKTNNKLIRFRKEDYKESPSWFDRVIFALDVLVDYTSSLGVSISTLQSQVAGFIGEYFTQSRLVTSAASLVTATTVNVTDSPMILAAGNWDIGFTVAFSGTGAVSTTIEAALSHTSATFPAVNTLAVPNTSGEFWIQGQALLGNNAEMLVGPSVRASFSNPTTFFLVSRCVFSAGSVITWGGMWARRVKFNEN